MSAAYGIRKDVPYSSGDRTTETPDLILTSDWVNVFIICEFFGTETRAVHDHVHAVFMLDFFDIVVRQSLDGLRDHGDSLWTTLEDRKQKDDEFGGPKKLSRLTF